MEKPLAVTGLRERLQRTVDHLRRLYYQNANIARKPTETLVSASNWQRQAPQCGIHHEPMHVNILPSALYAIGEPVCPSCHAERVEAMLYHQRAKTERALFPDDRPAKIMPGTKIRDIRRAMQQIVGNVTPDIITPETLTVPLQHSPIVPVRDKIDIRLLVNKALHPDEYPHKDISGLDTLRKTNTPLRAELFADVPTKAAWDHDEEGDPTQRRNAVPKITARIAGIDTTELILAEMARGLTSTHEQSTGENERLQRQDVSRML